MADDTHTNAMASAARPFADRCVPGRRRPFRRATATAIAGGALALVPLLGGTLAHGAGAEPVRAPDFVAHVAREGSVVVSIRIASPRRSFFPDDPDDALPARGVATPVREVDRRPVLTLSPSRSQASGIVVTSDGFILTSAHAVTSTVASVVLADGREFSGRLVGWDTRSDVALMKIEATGLAAARIGDPARLVPGDWVAASGSPFGFDATLTAGIVSARRYFPDGLGVAFIQTDVVINPGSSGGPLFNLDGEVVGMNSIIYTASGGYMGVSFALPIDVAMDVAARLREQGRVVRGHLGARVQEVSPGLARAFRRDDTCGALVTRVDRDSPAERAGLRMGDIVVSAGDDRAMSFAQVQQRVAATAPGTRLPLAVWRAGRLLSLVVEIDALDGGDTPLPAVDPPGQGDRLGLVVAEAPSRLDPLPAGEPRLVVREAHGAALRAGIGAGDLIVAVNSVAADRLALYQNALSRLPPRDPVALLVMRNGRTRYFALDP